MQYVKMDFRNRPALELLNLYEQHLANIKKLPGNLLAQVRLQEWDDTVTALRASHNEVENLRGQLKTAVARRKTLLRSARDQTTYACGMVAVNANYDTSTLLGAGLSLKAEKKPVGKPGAPTNFTAAPGANEGTVELSWKRPIRRCTFMVQMQADGESEWKNVEAPVPTWCVIEKLKPGGKYWFRVNAVNAHGPGPWTNAIAVRAK